MLITGFYGGLAALSVITLAVRVSLARRAKQIDLGDGGDAEMLRRIRVHANAVEYVPLALILLLMLELSATSAMTLHVFGIWLIVARSAHAIGASLGDGPNPGRASGAMLTWLLVISMAVLLLWRYCLSHNV
jgi:uncharacterized protein